MDEFQFCLIIYCLKRQNWTKGFIRCYHSFDSVKLKSTIQVIHVGTDFKYFVFKISGDDLGNCLVVLRDKHGTLGGVV